MILVFVSLSKKICRLLLSAHINLIRGLARLNVGLYLLVVSFIFHIIRNSYGLFLSLRRPYILQINKFYVRNHKLLYLSVKRAGVQRLIVLDAKFSV